MMVTKGVRIDENQLEKLEKTAEENGLNFSELMRNMINFYQKFPHEHIKNLEENSAIQADHIDRLAKVMLVQKEKIEEIEILIKRIFNQSLYSYKSIQFTMKSAQGNPAWQKVLDDIKSQAIESNHEKGEHRG